MNFARGLLLLLWVSGNAYSFEDTQVLPEGVRRISVRTVDAKVIGKADQYGKVAPLSAAIKKPLKFRDMADTKSGQERAMFSGYLTSQDIALDDAAGYFEADVATRVSVFAPIVGYGVTDKLTVGFALPFYRAQSSVALGFRYADSSRQLLSNMVDEGRQQEAAEIADGMNNAVGRLQARLSEEGYDELASWKGEGLGDVTVLAKYQGYQHRKITLAAQSGFVLPTGRVDDPDHLADVPFGEGQLSFFVGGIADYVFDRFFTCNLSYKYSMHSKSRQAARIGSSSRPFETSKANVEFSPGHRDLFDTSLNYTSRLGMLVGIGVVRERRFQHRGIASEFSEMIGKDGLLHQHNQWRVGYSSVQAYLNGKALAPTMASLTLMQSTRHINTVAASRLELDLSVFF